MKSFWNNWRAIERPAWANVLRAADSAAAQEQQAADERARDQQAAEARLQVAANERAAQQPQQENQQHQVLAPTQTTFTAKPTLAPLSRSNKLLATSFCPSGRARTAPDAGSAAVGENGIGPIAQGERPIRYSELRPAVRFHGEIRHVAACGLGLWALLMPRCAVVGLKWPPAAVNAGLHILPWCGMCSA
jgi:hypothetical protein